MCIFSDAGNLAGFLLYNNLLRQTPSLLYNSSGQAYDSGVFDFLLEPPAVSRSLILQRTSDLPASLIVCEIEAYVGGHLFSSDLRQK